jgi:hypothetical protein
VSWLLLLSLAAAPDGGTKIRLPTAQQELSEVEQRAIDQEYEKTMAMVRDGGLLGPKHPMFVWHISNIVESIDIPGIVYSNGFPVKMHALRVKQTEDEVFRELGEQFVSQGLYVKPMAKQPQLMKQYQLTGLDGDRGISYTAIVDPHKDGTCTVVLGEANIAEGLQLRKRGTGDDFAPLYPKAEGVTRTVAEGLRTMTFHTLDAEADVLAFYDKELKVRGYMPAGPHVFRRSSGEEIKLIARRVDGVLNVMMSQTSGAATAP